MGLLRQKGFVAAVATSAIVALYFALVAGRAIVFLTLDNVVGRALGVALLVLPMLGVWWLVHEWRLGSTVQRMADHLDSEGRLPIHDGEQDARGRLTVDAQEAVFEVARRGVELRPDDWASWFHVAYAYEAARDRQMARKSLRHAASLYRAAKSAERS